MEVLVWHHGQQVPGGCLPPGVLTLVPDVDGHALATLYKRRDHHLQLVLGLVDLLLEADIL